MKYADLHVHTYYSDSTFSPGEVVERAAAAGLSGVAICDHDTVGAVPEALACAPSHGIEIIPGIEITVEKDDAEIHMLGYFLDWRDRAFLDRLARLQDARLARIRMMAAKLTAAGIPLTFDDIKALAGKGTVGRLHVAQAMLKTGKVGSIRECFDRYIGFLKSCYVSHERFSPQEAIDLIRMAGGVPVLAHPAVTGRDEHIAELIERGLRGIEAYHTEHSASVSRRYERMAKSHGLIATGGSDCHGLGKGRVMLGGVRVPYTVVESLRQASREIRDAR